MSPLRPPLVLFAHRHSSPEELLRACKMGLYLGDNALDVEWHALMLMPAWRSGRLTESMLAKLNLEFDLLDILALATPTHDESTEQWLCRVSPTGNLSAYRLILMQGYFDALAHDIKPHFSRLLELLPDEARPEFKLPQRLARVALTATPVLH